MRCSDQSCDGIEEHEPTDSASLPFPSAQSFHSPNPHPHTHTRISKLPFSKTFKYTSRSPSARHLQTQRPRHESICRRRGCSLQPKNCPSQGNHFPLTERHKPHSSMVLGPKTKQHYRTHPLPPHTPLSTTNKPSGLQLSQTQRQRHQYNRLLNH